MKMILQMKSTMKFKNSCFKFCLVCSCEYESFKRTSGINDTCSKSFSGDDDGSLDSTPWLTGLYGGIVLTLPPFFCRKKNKTVNQVEINVNRKIQ